MIFIKFVLWLKINLKTYIYLYIMATYINLITTRILYVLEFILNFVVAIFLSQFDIYYV